MIDMDNVFEFGDNIGPYKTIHVQNQSVGLSGILVIDNVAAGPSIGGMRIAPDVTFQECARLARAMTLKNAAAGLPHGGGKSVIIGDPKMPLAEKERIVRAFASALTDEVQYIFGPDMGSNEECMAWVRDEIGRSVGLPSVLGGIPLDELGATGWGLAAAAVVVQEFCDLELNQATLAIQGFGSVGIHSARFLADRGVKLVAAADSGGTVHDAAGLDIEALVQLKRAGQSVTALPGTTALDKNAITSIPCDIWIPAARPDVIHAGNVENVNTKVILEGANIAITHDAEEILAARGIIVVPDFIANAGGVICAAMEYSGAGKSAAFDAIWEKVSTNTRLVLAASARDGCLPRASATALAQTRLESAMATRRFSLY